MLIKFGMIAAPEGMCPENANLFININLSTHTLARRVDISENILTELSNKNPLKMLLFGPGCVERYFRYYQGVHFYS